MSRHSGRRGRVSANRLTDCGTEQGGSSGLSISDYLSGRGQVKKTLSVEPKAEANFEDEKSRQEQIRPPARQCSPRPYIRQPAASSERTYLDALTGKSLSRALTPLKLANDAQQPRQREKVDPRYADMEASFNGALELQEHSRRQLFLRAEAHARGTPSDGESVVSENASFISFKSPRDQSRILPLQAQGPLHPIDTHGEQFYPITSAGPSSLPITRSVDFARTVSDALGVGIEAEFLLKPLGRRNRSLKIDLFAEKVVDNHNRLLVHPDPRYMESQVGVFPLRFEHDHWTLIDDSIQAKGSAIGLEMISPLFVAYQGSTWRSYVAATWESLERCYSIQASTECATHIHVSVAKGYSLKELKRIAQTIIHFEPAFNALVPHCRLFPINHYAKSNWLDSDELAKHNRMRAESINYLAKIRTYQRLLDVLQPSEDRHYAWNFRAYERYRTIEFRLPPASCSARECLAWAELAMTVVQAGIRHGIPEKLIRVPPTVGGLRWFLEQSAVPGLNEPTRLNHFWKMNAGHFVQGSPMGRLLTDEQRDMMGRLIEADTKRVMQASRLRPPYWD